MAELLTAAEMLVQLSEHGEDAGSDFNDSDAIEGWFGWTVAGDVLTVTHEPDYAERTTGPRASRRWRLVPIEDEQMSS